MFEHEFQLRVIFRNCCLDMSVLEEMYADVIWIFRIRLFNSYLLPAGGLAVIGPFDNNGDRWFIGAIPADAVDAAATARSW